jgi:ABC-2 type transport system permease protein
MKMLFQYRAAAFAGICTQVFWGIIQVMIFQAFYSGVSGREPMSLTQTITFIWLGQALLQLLPWSIDKEVGEQIRNGHVAYELIRPIHLYRLWYVRSFAMSFVPTVLRCAPIFILGGLFLGLAAPASWLGGFFFFLSVIFSFFLSAAIKALVISSLFWTISGEGILRLLPHITVLLSGMVIPLPLFPNWLQPFLSVQPFRGIIDIPSRLYTGIIPSSEAIYYLGFQLGWTILLIALGQFLLKKALRQFVVQGG